MPGRKNEKISENFVSSNCQNFSLRGDPVSLTVRTAPMARLTKQLASKKSNKDRCTSGRL